MVDEAWVGLAEAVQGLRQELLVAMAASAGEQLRFELGPVEVEFAVTVTRSGGGNIGLNVAVVSAGANAGRSSEAQHRLKLTLLPKDLVTGRTPEVSGWVDEIPAR